MNLHSMEPEHPCSLVYTGQQWLIRGLKPLSQLYLRQHQGWGATTEPETFSTHSRGLTAQLLLGSCRTWVSSVRNFTTPSFPLRWVRLWFLAQLCHVSCPSIPVERAQQYLVVPPPSSWISALQFCWGNRESHVMPLPKAQVERAGTHGTSKAN